MSNSNYPAGVTDSHPHFNPAPVSANAVECGADEALVVPSFAVKAELIELLAMMEFKPYRPWDQQAIRDKVAALKERVEELEQEREYECPFNDEIDLEESECARWDCPTCGNERETDTMPEERDPDEEWERRNDR